MKKKIVTLFLSACALLSLGFVACKDNSTEGLAYFSLPDGTYAVAQGSTQYLEEIIIPEKHKGKKVTAIAENGFKEAKLQSITIPDTITIIDSNAFNSCVNLTSVVIPDSVTSIGDNTFSGCNSLTSIEIPDSVTSIGKYTFEGCSSLTSVVIPASVTSIGYYAFRGCYNLTSVYITDIKAWCNISFGDYSANPLSRAENFYLNNELVTELVIPSSVTSIGERAFGGCSSLTSVVIPDSVTSIGESAFEGCSSLTNVVIHNSVTSIGKFAFYNCDSLESVYITDIEAWCSISHIAYCSKAINLYLNNELVTELVIPDTVTSIDVGAFEFCNSLTSVVIPNSLTSIGDYAFNYCDNLTSVVIPDSVTSIGDYAFNGCSSLIDVYYKGTKSEWANISMGAFNYDLTDAKRYYYSEAQPSETGNYWHYVDGIPTAW